MEIFADYFEYSCDAGDRKSSLKPNRDDKRTRSVKTGVKYVLLLIAENG